MNHLLNKLNRQYDVNPSHTWVGISDCWGYGKYGPIYTFGTDQNTGFYKPRYTNYYWNPISGYTVRGL